MDDTKGVEIRTAGNVGVVAFKATSISDVEGITLASKQIKEFIEHDSPAGIVFDFERVKFFSS